jgi:hypothetical protein
VESLHAVAEIADDGERATAAADARRYFQLALQYAVCGSSPLALVFMGRVASGKSTLAAALARELGWQLISSDLRRKTLAGVPPHERGDAAGRKRLYSSGMTEQTYDSMIQDAREILHGGHGVILDATFSKRAFRDRLREKVGDENVKWIVAEVDEATARKRLRQRDAGPDVVSDARLGDQQTLDAAFEAPDELPPDEVFHLSSASEPEESTRRLLSAMSELRARAALP